MAKPERRHKVTLEDIAETQREHDVLLSEIHRHIHELLAHGVADMKANEQVLAFLDQLKTRTDQMATNQDGQTAKLVEIRNDIQQLLTDANAELPASTQERLQSALTGLDNNIAFETAQSADLTAIAALNDNPLPPPVEPARRR